MAEIVTPIGVDWRGDRGELWNAAERSERRSNSCVGREHVVALPHELSAEQQLALVRRYAQDISDRHQCAVDFSIHDPDFESSRCQNVHGHLVCSTRKLHSHGFGEKCDRERAGRSRRVDLRAERSRWEELANEALAAADLDVRIDHRSHEERGIEDLPTIHVGRNADAKFRREHNDQVREVNVALRELNRQRDEDFFAEKSANLAHVELCRPEGKASNDTAQRLTDLEVRPAEPSEIQVHHALLSRVESGAFDPHLPAIRKQPFEGSRPAAVSTLQDAVRKRSATQTTTDWQRVSKLTGLVPIPPAKQPATQIKLSSPRFTSSALKRGFDRLRRLLAKADLRRRFSPSEASSPSKTARASTKAAFNARAPNSILRKGVTKADVGSSEKNVVAGRSGPTEAVGKPVRVDGRTLVTRLGGVAAARALVEAKPMPIVVESYFQTESGFDSNGDDEHELEQRQVDRPRL